MLCNECGKSKATVHITKIINGQKTETHLCEECAKKYSTFNPSFSMESFFAGLLNDAFETEMVEGTGCNSCGMTYNEFTHLGKFGCSECYNNFKSRLMPVIKNIQGYDTHTGKVPKKTGGKIKIKRDIENLRNELKLAVEKEEYENAAKLRDKIREMEKEL